MLVRVSRGGVDCTSAAGGSGFASDGTESCVADPAFLFLNDRVLLGGIGFLESRVRIH